MFAVRVFVVVSGGLSFWLVWIAFPGWWVWNSAFTCFVSFCGLASVLLSSGLICLLVVFGLG